MGPEMLSSTGAAVWRKAPGALSDSSSALDKSESVTQESPRQTKPKRGPNRKVHEFLAHCFVNSGVFP